MSETRDTAVLAVALILLGCLLFPALAQSNSHSEQAICLNKLKNLALAMMNHHDTRKAFPLSSSEPINHKPGSAEAETAAGYSWLTSLLPFIEQQQLADPVFKARKEKSAFDPDVVASEGGKPVHPAAVVVNDFLCPSFLGNAHVAANDADYKPFKDGSLPALSNYNALAGSHFFNATGIGRLNPPDRIESAYEGDGAMPFPGTIKGKLQKVGLSIRSISDGTSNTISIAETLEPAYSAWLDGQSTWLVAAWPGNAKIPTVQQAADNPALNVLCWNDSDKKTSRVAVDIRNADGSPNTYLAVGRWSGSKERRYAAGSNHPGVVGHTYLDGHVEMISTDVDPNTYIQLVTRNGREVISGEFKRQQERNRVPTGRLASEAASPRESSPQSGGGVQVIPDQWTSPIDWSPVSIGDLRLAFPQLLSTNEFRPYPVDRSLLTFTGKSTVFSDIVFDTKTTEFRLFVVDREATTAMPKLYKQLRASLGDPTVKEVDKRPKRVTWKKDAKWTGGAAAFEFILTEAADKEPASVAIRVTPSK